jgi:hypothetical protein
MSALNAKPQRRQEINRIMKKRLTVIITVLMIALAHRSDGQQPQSLADQLKLASVMPRGAIVYVQAADLGALMKTWLASTIRTKFYDSASFTAFQKSHAYLKIQDRIKDFETAIGIRIDEKRLAELAGRASAVSIYEIGKLEMVFVTEIPRARAVISSLFKQAPQFTERSADGASYYVRDVTTDGGRLNQQFCFAYTEGKLVITTTEGLMIRALANAKSTGVDSMGPEVLGLAEQSKDFSAHDVTMWLDQARLNQNRYFDNYWIHQNADELANIESALVDLRNTREALLEQRWFKVGSKASAPNVTAETISADQLASFMRFTPASAQLVRNYPVVGLEGLSRAVESTLFGNLPNESWSPSEAPDRTRASRNEGESYRNERYSRLDSRFDVDVDDEQAPKRGKTSDDQPKENKSKEPATHDFANRISAILSSVTSTSHCLLERSRVDAGKPFVRFERGIVVQLRPEAAINREALETAIVDELRTRYVIAGTQPRLLWQDDGSVRFVAQALLEQGAAYSVSGNYLVLASSKEFINDILQAARSGNPSAEKPAASADFVAVIRVSDAKVAFDTLMSKLDGKGAGKSNRGKDEEGEIKFFSDNLSSLVAASTFREIRLTRQTVGAMSTERVIYLW